MERNLREWKEKSENDLTWRQYNKKKNQMNLR